MNETKYHKMVSRAAALADSAPLKEWLSAAEQKQYWVERAVQYCLADTQKTPDRTEKEREYRVAACLVLHGALFLEKLGL